MIVLPGGRGAATLPRCASAHGTISPGPSAPPWRQGSPRGSTARRITAHRETRRRTFPLSRFRRHSQHILSSPFCFRTSECVRALASGNSFPDGRWTVRQLEPIRRHPWQTPPPPGLTATGRPEPSGRPRARVPERHRKTALLTAADEVELAKRIEAGLYAQHLLRTRKRMSENRKRDLSVVVRDGQAARRHLWRPTCD